jgi:MoaA/NifB/PqqE/SkfB family radical SAM enzyme
LNFAITYRCNLKCKICNIWKKKSTNELTLEEIEKTAKKNNFFSWISLTGGEPFLRKDIVEIVNIFNHQCKNLYLLNIPTNGFLPNLIVKRTKEMLNLGIPKIVITPSLDGPKHIHDLIKGKKGSWERTIKTFKQLKELSEKNRNLEVLFSFTLSPFNVGRFKDTIFSVKKIVNDIKISDFHINLFHFSEHFYSNLGFKIPSNYKKNLIKEIKKINEAKAGYSIIDPIKFIEKEYTKLASRYIETNKIPLICKAIASSLFLDPFGNVYPCIIFNKKLGNIRETNYELSKILNSNFTKSIKIGIRKGKCPHCWTPCEANQTILNSLIKFQLKGL